MRCCGTAKGAGLLRITAHYTGLVTRCVKAFPGGGIIPTRSNPRRTLIGLCALCESGPKLGGRVGIPMIRQRCLELTRF